MRDNSETAKQSTGPAAPQPAPLAAVNPIAAEIVTMSGVRFAWPGRNPFAISVEDFSVTRGTRLLLLGPSGSGKSTFLNLLCGIITPQEGRISVLGTNIGKLSGSARDQFRAEHFGIIFQMFNLLPYASVIDNVVLPLQFSSKRRKRAQEVDGGSVSTESERLLTRLGLERSVIQGLTASSLSVGQQQRVAAARALIGRPELIVADEPTSSLDRGRQAAFLDLLFAEAEAAGATVIMVSHDESLAPAFSDVRRLDDIAKGSRSAAPC